MVYILYHILLLFNTPLRFIHLRGAGKTEAQQYLVDHAIGQKRKSDYPDTAERHVVAEIGQFDRPWLQVRGDGCQEFPEW